jgi:putative membrane protein
MTRFILRWLINTVALYAAVAFVPGIAPQSDNWLSFVWLALIFGLLNALLRPLLKLLTFPLISACSRWLSTPSCSGWLA